MAVEANKNGVQTKADVILQNGLVLDKKVENIAIQTSTVANGMEAVKQACERTANEQGYLARQNSEIFQKLSAENKALKQELMFISAQNENVYTGIAKLIAKQSDVTVLKVKDYIKNPKPNGYKSYHMIVSVPIFLADTIVNTKVEIQIRTIAMDFWASLEHKMYYKFEGNAPESIRRELKECADLVAFLDQKMLAINEEIKHYSGEEEDDDDSELDDELRVMYGTVLDEKKVFEEAV